MNDPVRDNIIFWGAYIGGVIVGASLLKLWQVFNKWLEKS